MVSKIWDWNSASAKLSCETNFFFFSVESLALTKMDRLIITQRIQMIKIYYKNGDSATATYHVLRAIGKIVKKFEETGVVTKIEKSVHHRFTRSAENIALVNRPSLVGSVLAY